MSVVALFLSVAFFVVEFIPMSMALNSDDDILKRENEELRIRIKDLEQLVSQSHKKSSFLGESEKYINCFRLQRRNFHPLDKNQIEVPTDLVVG